ncbi:hypothetical protein KC315_g36 [Hortaea werneckii]|nr:hypothetical protein KC315_g36 [Hortaea werneckii]
MTARPPHQRPETHPTRLRPREAPFLMKKRPVRVRQATTPAKSFHSPAWLSRGLRLTCPGIRGSKVMRPPAKALATCPDSCHRTTLTHCAYRPSEFSFWWHAEPAAVE